MSLCPVCGATVNVREGTRAGEIVACSECDAQLEVLSLGPVELGVAPEVEEDWGE